MLDKTPPEEHHVHRSVVRPSRFVFSQAHSDVRTGDWLPGQELAYLVTQRPDGGEQAITEPSKIILRRLTVMFSAKAKRCTSCIPSLWNSRTWSKATRICFCCLSKFSPLSLSCLGQLRAVPCLQRSVCLCSLEVQFALILMSYAAQKKPYFNDPSGKKQVRSFEHMLQMVNDLYCPYQRYSDSVHSLIISSLPHLTGIA